MVHFELLPPVQPEPEPEPKAEPEPELEPPSHDPLPRNLESLRPYEIKKLALQRDIKPTGAKQELLRQLREYEAHSRRPEGGREEDYDAAGSSKQQHQAAQLRAFEVERAHWDAGEGAAAIRKVADDFSTADGIPGLLPAGASWFRVAQSGRDSVVPGWLSLRQLRVGFEVHILPDDEQKLRTSVVDAVRTLASQVKDRAFVPSTRSPSDEARAAHEAEIADADAEVTKAEELLQQHNSRSKGFRANSARRSAQTAFDHARVRAQPGRWVDLSQSPLETMETLDSDHIERREHPSNMHSHIKLGGARIIEILPSTTHYGWTALRKSCRVWRAVETIGAINRPTGLQLVDVNMSTESSLEETTGEERRRRGRWVTSLESRSTGVNVNLYYGMPRLVDWYSRVLTSAARKISLEESVDLPMAAEAVINDVAMHEQNEPALARYYGYSMPLMTHFYSSTTPAFKASLKQPEIKTSKQARDDALNDLSELDALAELDTQSTETTDELEMLAELVELDELAELEDLADLDHLDEHQMLDSDTTKGLQNPTGVSTASENKTSDCESGMESFMPKIQRNEPILARFYGSEFRRPMPNPVTKYYTHGLDGISGHGDWLIETHVHHDVAAEETTSASESDGWSEAGDSMSVEGEQVETESLRPIPPRPPEPIHKLVEELANGLQELVADEWPFSSHLPVSLSALRKMSALLNADRRLCRFCQQCNQVFGEDISVQPFANRQPPPTSSWRIEVLPPATDSSAHRTTRHLHPEKSAAEAWQSLVSQTEELGGLIVGNFRCHVSSIDSGADKPYAAAIDAVDRPAFPGTSRVEIGGSQTRLLCPRGCAFFRSTPAIPIDLVNAINWSLQVAEFQERFWLAEVSCYAFCARRIQRAWQWRKDEGFRKTRDSAARRLQRVVRQHKQTRLNSQRTSACLRLQPVIRGWLLRTRLHSVRQAQAATIIVAVWRGCCQRNRLRQQFSDGLPNVLALANEASLPAIVKILAACRNSRGDLQAVVEPVMNSLTVVPPQQVHAMNFEVQRGSDVELIVHAEADAAPTKFWCHRAILSRCGYFNSLFTGNREPRYSTRLLRETVGLPASTVPDVSVESVRHALCWIYGRRFKLDSNHFLALHTLAVDLACQDLVDCCNKTALDSRFVRVENVVTCYMDACQARHGQPIANRYWQWIVEHAAQLCAAGPEAVKSLSPKMASQLIAAVHTTDDTLNDGGAASRLALRIAVHWAAATARRVCDLTEVFDGCRWHAGASNLFPALPGGAGYDEQDGVVQPAVWKHLVDRLHLSDNVGPVPTFSDSGGSDEELDDTAESWPSPPPLLRVDDFGESDLSSDYHNRRSEAMLPVDGDRLLEEASTAVMHESLRDDVRQAAGLVPLHQSSCLLDEEDSQCASQELRHMIEDSLTHSQPLTKDEHAVRDQSLSDPNSTSSIHSTDSDDDTNVPEVTANHARRARIVLPPERPVVISGGRRLAFQWSALPKDVAGPDSVDEVEIEAELTLRSELVTLSVSALQEKAFVEGVEATAVADASLDNETENDKRRALIKLLVDHASGLTPREVQKNPYATSKSSWSTRRRRRPRVPERPHGARGKMLVEPARLPRVPASRLEPSLTRLS